MQDLAALVGDPVRLARWAEPMLELLTSSAAPDDALNNLVRYFEGATGPSNFLAFLESNPAAAAVLVQLLGGSPFLSQLLLRNPEYFYWLIEDNRLEPILSEEYYQRESERCLAYSGEPQAVLNALRRLRRRETLRIGAQDLLQRSGMDETVLQISLLAESTLQAVFRLLAGDRPLGFAVLAMGKLGGRELNFSSDIDLIYLYEDESEREPMLRFAREFTRALTEFTQEGRLFRVDLRLRPMGASGEIAYSLPASRHYYQTWADTGDRLALLKCRPAAGDLELGNRFLESIESFLYPRYLDHFAIEEIRWMKERSDARLKRSQSESIDIKLGGGGIREIEFFVQSFQLLYAGRHRRLRTHRTLDALRELVRLDYIQVEEGRRLADSYRFLRNLEHKLQLVHDLQTHALPDGEVELRKCARRMGFASLREFESALAGHRRSVSGFYRRLFSESSDEPPPQQAILRPGIDSEEAVRRLGEAGAFQPNNLYEGIRLLADAKAFPHSPARLRNLLANLIPEFTRLSPLADDPRIWLSRLDRFFEAAGSRVSLLSEMVENAEFARRLLTVLASGDFLAEILIRNPELLDTIGRPPERGRPRRRLENLLEFTSPDRVPEALRRFKRREDFKAAVGLLFEKRRPEQVHRLLSDAAESCLEASIRRVLTSAPELQSGAFQLLALGRLGGRELSFQSDLDLVLVVDDENSSAALSDFHSLLQGLRQDLQEITSAGRAYQLDFRLRPEGRHGAEIVPLSAFRTYFRERADSWELLAYVKARSVLAHGLDIVENGLLQSLLFSHDLDADELDHVRRRKELEIGKEEGRMQWDLKVGRGGLLDIQFVVQFLQILHQIPNPNLLSALSELGKTGRIGKSDSRIVSEAARFYHRVELVNSLFSPGGRHQLSRKPGSHRRLAGFFGFASEELFMQKVGRLREKVRGVYRKFFPA